jgi:hypothetical protein
MTTHSTLYDLYTPTRISPPAVHSGVDITIQNLSTSDVYIGSSAVTTSDYGYKLAAGQAISFVLKSKDELYAVTTAIPTSPPSAVVAVLTVGIN